jgi:Transposase, Mutator family
VLSGSPVDGTELMSKAEFAEWLRRHIDERTPATAVRFGDAEARLLDVDPDDVESIRVATHKLEHETGVSFSPGEVLEIKALVRQAFDEADVVGIRFGDRLSDEGQKWMNRLGELYAKRLAAGRRNAPLAHRLLNHDIFDALPELLRGRRVSVVTCRDIRPILETDWGLGDVAVYQVPSQYTMRHVDGAYEAALHRVPIWPDIHTRISSELAVRERGEVFLVGAGLFGKDLCIRIRDRGGIALDMGSALDRIAGKITRGPRQRTLALHAGGMPVRDIASDLERRYGVPVEPNVVSQGIADTAGGDLTAWRTRPLRTEYETVSFDALRVEIGEASTVRSRTCYLAFGVGDGDGRSLGLWWQDVEGPEFWLGVLGDLEQRGVSDIRIVHADAPRGLSEAVEAVFPRAEVQPSADAIEECAAVREAVERHGRFSDEQAATTLIYLALGPAESSLRKPAPSADRRQPPAIR